MIAGGLATNLADAKGSLRGRLPDGRLALSGDVCDGAPEAARLSQGPCQGLMADRMVLKGRKSRISPSISVLNPNRS